MSGSTVSMLRVVLTCQKGFKNVVSKGRVKATSKGVEKGGKSEGKEVKVNG